MKKTFYIFRHGETDMNAKNIWQGARINVALNDNGKKQAEQLGQKLLPLGIEVIYSSNLRRALQTSLIVNKSLEVPAFLCGGLIECNFGDAEGKTYDELKQLCPETMNAVLHPTPATWDTRYPGLYSESKHEVYTRVRNALVQIADETKNSVIGISTHGGVMSALLAGLGNYGTDLPNCCVAKVEYNDVSHRMSFVKML